MAWWLVGVAWAAPDGMVSDWFGPYPYREDLDWEIASNVLLAAGFVLPVVPVGPGELRAPGYAAGVAERVAGVGVALGLGEVGKLVTHRERPYFAASQCTPVGDRYRCDLYGRQRELASSSVFASFPSGHTATVGASTFGWVTSRTLANPDLPLVEDLASYAVATGATVLTGFARVNAGKHHPSDVLVGGLVGAASGVVVPLLLHPVLHPRPPG